MARRVAARVIGLTEERFTVANPMRGNGESAGSSYREGGGGDKREGLDDRMVAG